MTAMRPDTRLDRSPLQPPEHGTPLLTRRSFWLATAAIWSFFGLMVANQLYFSMRGHGHDWWRILVWQMAGAATWMLLGPVVLALESRFPLEATRRLHLLGVHFSAAVAGSLVRMIPMTAVSLALDPYRPVPTESSFAAEYAVQALQWLHLDLFLYGAILVAAYAYRSRAQLHRDQLRAAHLEKELASAELRALRLELQPHFLFNTMNSVVSLVRVGDGARAERMLLGLCELLRSTLDGHRRQLVPLADEMKLTERYLDIQRVRFGDRLAFEWTIEPGTEQTLVPSLLLQPLIENSVRHAVEMGSGRGRITVEVARADRNLLIDVEDDGSDVVTLADPTRAAIPEDPPTSRGLGLDNVRRRLGALYGDRWALDIEPKPERGTRVRLRFPRRAAPESSDDGGSA
ncbi:MAG: histidine kinase [Acidobacteriota bacterium]